MRLTLVQLSMRGVAGRELKVTYEALSFALVLVASRGHIEQQKSMDIWKVDSPCSPFPNSHSKMVKGFKKAKLPICLPV